MATITVYGNSYEGSSIEIKVDGKPVEKGSEAEGEGPVRISVTGGLASLTTDASVSIGGDVSGDVSAGNDVKCGGVSGGVNCGNDVKCGGVGGGLSCGNDVKCGGVGGGLNCGGDVKCGGVSGDVGAGGDVRCGDVKGYIKASRDVTCGHVGGDVEARGNVNCEVVDGHARAGGDVEARGDVPPEKEQDRSEEKKPSDSRPSLPPLSMQKHQILSMLREGKITVDEAERLLAAVEPFRPSMKEERKQSLPKYLRVVVEEKKGDRINVRVPLGLIRAGVKLGALLPEQARKELSAKGIDLEKLKSDDVEELIAALAQLTVDVEEKDGDKVQVFCE